MFPDDFSDGSSVFLGMDPQGDDGMDHDMAVVPHHRFVDLEWEYYTNRPLAKKTNRIIRVGDTLLIGLEDYMDTSRGVEYTLAQVTNIREHETVRNGVPFEIDFLSDDRESDTTFVPAAAPGEAPQVQATGRGKKRIRDSFSRAHIDEDTLIKLSPNDEKGCALKWFVFVPRMEPATHPAASQHGQVTTAALALSKMRNETVEALARADAYLNNRSLEARAQAICRNPCPRCKEYKSIDEWPSDPSEVLRTQVCWKCFDSRCSVCKSAMDKDQWRGSYKAAKCRGCSEKKEAKDSKRKEEGCRTRERAKYEGQIRELNKIFQTEKEPTNAKCWLGARISGSWKNITILSHPGDIKLYTKNGQGKKARVRRDAVIAKDDRGRFVVVHVSRIWCDTQCRVWDPREQKEGTFANRLTGTVEGHVRVRWANKEATWEKAKHVHSVVLDAPRKVAPPSRFSPGGKHNVLSSDLHVEHPSEQFQDEFPRASDKEIPLLDDVHDKAVAKMAPRGEFSSIPYTIEAAMDECKGSANGKAKALLEDPETEHSIKELVEHSLLFLMIRGPRNEGEPPLPGQLPAVVEALSAGGGYGGLGPNYVRNQGLFQSIAKIGDVQRPIPSLPGSVFEHMYDGKRFRNAKAIVEDDFVLVNKSYKHKRVSELGDSKRKTPPAKSRYSTRSSVRSFADLYSWQFEDARESKHEAASEKQKQGLCEASSADKRIKLDDGGGKGKKLPVKLCTWKSGCTSKPHSSSKGRLCRKHMTQAGEKVKMCVACGRSQSRRKGGFCTSCFKKEHSSSTATECTNCTKYGYRRLARERGGLCKVCTGAKVKVKVKLSKVKGGQK
jgi:hypothetical protein